MPKVSAKYGEETENLDGEESQREDVSGAGKAGGEDCGSHESSVGGQGGGESSNR